jgi:hypothetical protein
MNEDKCWELYFDTDGEYDHHHAGIISFRILSKKRAEEILDNAVSEGVT